MIKKEGIYTFVIVRAEKEKKAVPKVERKPREKKPSRWKGAIIGMKKLGIGDYLEVAKDVPEAKIYQKVANIKYMVTHLLGKGLPRRKFEFKGIPEAIDGGAGFKVIIRRTE